MTIRPLITAPPDSLPPSSNEGQLANLVSDTGAVAGATSQSKSPGRKYHRRGKEKRFGRGFRLIRHKHPFAEDFKVGSPSSSSGSQGATPPPPLQTSSTEPPQFANQVISLDSTGVPSTNSTTSTPLVNTFDNQILVSTDQTEVKKQKA